MTPPRAFLSLLREAQAQPLHGWDFDWIEGRVHHTHFPWEYLDKVCARAAESPDLLDLGTGGGELLASMPARPAQCVATESYGPNVPVAYRRLRPLGVGVVRISGSPDNDQQTVNPLPTPGLPFRSGAFHLVIDRHEAYVAREVARVLAPGGWFVTQQLSEGGESDWRRLFDLPPVPREATPWGLGLAREQLERAGLRARNAAEGACEMAFLDVGAVVWYLRMVAWSVPGFSVRRHRVVLEKLHGRITGGEPLRIQQVGFWVEAQRP